MDGEGARLLGLLPRPYALGADPGYFRRLPEARHSPATGSIWRESVVGQLFLVVEQPCATPTVQQRLAFKD